MIANELSEQVLNLPVEDRLNLARQLVESVVTPDSLTEGVRAGIQRIEDVASGRVVGLTEEQFRSALK
jgi:hypothetical protein